MIKYHVITIVIVLELETAQILMSELPKERVLPHHLPHSSVIYSPSSNFVYMPATARYSSWV
jgi:hypothetical protein